VRAPAGDASRNFLCLGSSIEDIRLLVGSRILLAVTVPPTSQHLDERLDEHDHEPGPFATIVRPAQKGLAFRSAWSIVSSSDAARMMRR
jgi:hypothetical protein